MKVYLILIVAILALGGLSCQSLMHDDGTREQMNVNAGRIEYLMGEIAKNQEIIKQGELDAEKLLALNESLVNAYIEMDQLMASNKALSETTGTPEWLLLLESALLGTIGARFTRGPASKGVLQRVPVLGKGSSGVI